MPCPSSLAPLLWSCTMPAVLEAADFATLVVVLSKQTSCPSCKRQRSSPAGVLHTIFFHRALGAVKPLEKDCELFDITYAQCNDAAVDQRIATVVSQFEAWALGHSGKRGQVCTEIWQQADQRLQKACPWCKVQTCAACEGQPAIL